MDSENVSLKSVPKTPPGSVGSSKKVTFVRPKPKLYIPPPPPSTSSSVKNKNAGKITSVSSVPTAATNTSSSPVSPETYRRKASVFIFDQINDIKESGLGIGERCSFWLYKTARFLSRRWFTHCFLIIVVFLYTVCGALIFLTLEGQNETKWIEHDIKLQTRDLLMDLRKKSLTLPRQLSQREWRGIAVTHLFAFGDRITEAYDHHPLIVSHTDGRVWTISNAVVYCATLYTTIGYGHIYPTTFTGRVFTIVYSTIGIPLFLIVLTDFGKLFTRAIKFVWSYVRRLYYTGSCRRVRKTSHVKEFIKGAQVMYEIATFRRPSVFQHTNNGNESASTTTRSVEPPTPAVSAFEIDDEFNLPVTLALFILVAYMLIGAAVFMYWEGWEFFSSFYFIFISMSTVGFGDVVPAKPIYMILSIVYLCFGLALMTMCINVVQDKLSDTFSQASAKLSATMGIVTDNDEDVDQEDAEKISNDNVPNDNHDSDEQQDEVEVVNEQKELENVQIENESKLV